MVHGEVCVGIFAIRDIKKGEDVTFHYQYVPVSGAAIKKCYCGAAKCQGYIGGNSSDAGAMVQGYSDEDPTPVMIIPELEKDTFSISVSDAYPLDALIQTIGHIQSENTTSNVVSVFNTSSHSSGETEAEETMCRQRSDTQPLDLTKSSSASFPMSSVVSVFNTSSHSSDETEAEETVCRPRSDTQPLDLTKPSSTSFPMSVFNTFLHSSDETKAEETICRQSMPLAT